MNGVKKDNENILYAHKMFFIIKGLITAITIETRLMISIEILAYFTGFPETSFILKISLTIKVEDVITQVSAEEPIMQNTNTENKNFIKIFCPEKK